MSEFFRYQGCGLDNVFLVNGYKIIESVAGNKSIFIEDIEDLHKAIARSIVDDASPLDAQTFKFLRKELGMSQRQFGEFLDMTEGSVSLWERARQPIPQAAQIFIRALVKEKCSGNAELMKTIERLNTLDREERRLIAMEKTNDHWETRKVA